MVSKTTQAGLVSLSHSPGLCALGLAFLSREPWRLCNGHSGQLRAGRSGSHWWRHPRAHYAGGEAGRSLNDPIVAMCSGDNPFWNTEESGVDCLPFICKWAQHKNVVQI